MKKKKINKKKLPNQEMWLIGFELDKEIWISGTLRQASVSREQAVQYLKDNRSTDGLAVGVKYQPVKYSRVS